MMIDSARAAAVRVGCDVGGTFTDFVMAPDGSDQLWHLKVPSTPEAPSRAVIEGLAKLLAGSDIRPADVDSFIHGTTLAVNTIIQRLGVSTGLLVTRGFQDVLELGRLRLPDPTNYFTARPAPLVPRKHVREISERTLANGRERSPLDVDEVLSAVKELTDDGVEALAISFLHSYVNADHEQRAVAAIQTQFPDLFVTCSSAVWPQRNEYERTLVTVMNAYVGRRMTNYFQELQDDLAQLGVERMVFSTRSNGGIMTLRSVGSTPVATLLSGPASGVMGAVHVAGGANLSQIVTFDMGGTSADVSVVSGRPALSTESEVGGLPCIMPAIDITSIGAGGGSIGWSDEGGALKVGPRSAGSNPGPACYGRGGKEPTVTDAYVRLGLIDPEAFLGGELRLDEALATAALKDAGARIGLDDLQTAAGIVAVATANMYAEFMPLMAGKGVDPRDFTLVAYGGAGPTHAFLLAREVGIPTVLIPPSPGTLCALGCLALDLKNDFVATLTRRVDPNSIRVLEDAYRNLESDARAWLEDEAVEVVATELIRMAEMRYVGQSFEIPVTLPSQLQEEGDLRSRFTDAYRATYGFSDDSAPIEVVNARVTVVGIRSGGPHLPASGEEADPSSAEELSALDARDVYHDGAWISVPVYRRVDLPQLRTFSGPAIVEQYDTTTFITPEFRAYVDRAGNIVARRHERPS